MAVQNVLLPTLIQDPTVLMNRKLALNAIQPVIAKDPNGFFAGPLCQRVAIVDLNPKDGTLGRPVPFDPQGSPYQNVAAYQSVVPLTTWGKRPLWVKSEQASSGGVSDLDRPDYSEPFLKVNAFGTVLRTIAFMEGKYALARQVRWAFPGKQLLVVPRAGELANAFYHRESHSLLLYYFQATEDPPQTVYSALSQDIVAHEAAHAVIDAVAPDLYHAGSPDSLAVHESLADLTAVLLSLRNRELRMKDSQVVQEMRQSSRFSRVAEQFALWRGQGQALRDVHNDKTLNPNDLDPARRVDPTSPHSLSEVLSGAVFRVFDLTIENADWEALLPSATNSLLDKIKLTTHRIASLIFKGLEWLPPGEVSLADYVRAMLAADAFYLSDYPQQRTWLLEECLRRWIFAPGTSLEDSPLPDLGPVEFDRWNKSAQARRQFIRAHQERLGIPPRTAFSVKHQLSEIISPKLYTATDHSEIISLAGPPRIPRPATPRQLLLLKVAWETHQAHSLGKEFGPSRRVKTGLTLALLPDGQVFSLLRGGQDLDEQSRRGGFLRRLALAGVLMPPGQAIGLDGQPLQGSLRTELQDGVLQLSGAFCALHIADDLP